MLIGWIFVMDFSPFCGTRYALDQSNAHVHLSSRPFCCDNGLPLANAVPHPVDWCCKVVGVQPSKFSGKDLPLIEDLYELLGLHDDDFAEVSEACYSMGRSKCLLFCAHLAYS